MKYILFAFFLFVISSDLFAQSQIDQNNPIQTQSKGTNYITCSQYESIKYDGFTIGQINNTNGDYTNLWGQADSIEDHDGWAKTYHYGNNSVGYNEDGYLSGITVESSQWPILIMNEEIRVGDSFSKLKQNYGSDLKIIYEPDLGFEYVVSFNCNGNSNDGIHIIFNLTTHKIEKIKYWVNT